MIGRTFCSHSTRGCEDQRGECSMLYFKYSGMIFTRLRAVLLFPPESEIRENERCGIPVPEVIRSGLGRGKVGTADNTGRFELPVAHTTENSHSLKMTHLSSAVIWAHLPDKRESEICRSWADFEVVYIIECLKRFPSISCLKPEQKAVNNLLYGIDVLAILTTCFQERV